MSQILEENIAIQNMIYEIRGKQVMLDSDLAKLYGVETRMLNQKVKGNIERFPEDFCFQMTVLEFKNWKSQIVMSESDMMRLRRPPYAFTEQGVVMLATILKSRVATQVSIAIMDAFAKTKKYGHFIKICYNNQQINV